MRDQIKITGALILLFCAGISNRQEADTSPPSRNIDTVRYCEVLSNFKDYDGKAVVTTSFAGVSFHSDALFDPACMSTDTENRSVDFALPTGWNLTKLGKKLEKVFRHNQIARITFEGTFHSGKQRYGADGARFRFTMQRLISVEKVSKKEVMPDPLRLTGKPSH